jgi:isocitrate lyase
MENKKQTAVDYIVNVVNSCIVPNYIPNEIVKQAKQMEKEQIINTFKDAQLFKVMNYETRAEQYYNETYGKN